MILSVFYVRSQVLPWVVNPSGDIFESGYDIAIDSEGNIYVIGNFISPDITFNAGKGTAIPLLNDESYVNISESKKNEFLLRLKEYARPL